LASVREEREDELLLSGASASTTASAAAAERGGGEGFSGTAPHPHGTGHGLNVRWSIKTHRDVASVLRLLDCAEYLPRFREQEIDMQAFLLLDEENLRDIGVATLGARKKIFNAITKLRESAGKHG